MSDQPQEQDLQLGPNLLRLLAPLIGLKPLRAPQHHNKQKTTQFFHNHAQVFDNAGGEV